MALWLKQSTATTIVLGPFLSDADGKTLQTALTIAQADVRLTKNAGSYAQKSDATSATHMENGYYSVPLNTTDTGTLGVLKVSVYKSGSLVVWENYHVVPANVWDSMFGASYLSVNMTQCGGGTVASGAIPNVAAGSSGGLPTVDASNAVKLQSGTGANQISLNSGLVTLAGVTHTGAVIPTVSTISSAVTVSNIPSVKKNTALSGFMFYMVDSTDHRTPKTGLTVTAYRALDGGSFAACTNSASEVGSGWYKIDLSSSDLNANTVALRFTATGADQTNMLIVTNV